MKKVIIIKCKAKDLTKEIKKVADQYHLANYKPN